MKLEHIFENRILPQHKTPYLTDGPTISSTSPIMDIHKVPTDAKSELSGLILKDTILQNGENIRRSFVGLREELIKARDLLELPDNFDGEGSPRYGMETFKLATDFVASLWELLSDQNFEEIQVPNILPGPDGTIDIYWDSPKFALLINVSTSEKQAISYYGKTGDKEIEGSDTHLPVSKIADFIKRVQV